MECNYINDCGSFDRCALSGKSCEFEEDRGVFDFCKITAESFTDPDFPLFIRKSVANKNLDFKILCGSKSRDFTDRVNCELKNENCVEFLKNTNHTFDLSFLDPPFNQGKEYRVHNDKLDEKEYWDWMREVCSLIYEKTSKGGAIYFMQREKNAEFVLEVLRSSGWTLQNLIIWKKKSSAVPSKSRFGKHYQIIAYCTKGKRERVFNKLRINPPLLVTDKYERPNGMFVTDVWDDIRELTSGYFAGDEPLRAENGDRAHKQQSPIQLLARIILSSSNIGDTVFDPFAGTGTTLVVAKQLLRNSIGVEIDPENASLIDERLEILRPSDNILKFRDDYSCTANLGDIWHLENDPNLNISNDPQKN